MVCHILYVVDPFGICVYYWTLYQVCCYVVCTLQASLGADPDSYDEVTAHQMLELYFEVCSSKMSGLNSNTVTVPDSKETCEEHVKSWVVT